MVFDETRDYYRYVDCTFICGLLFSFVKETIEREFRADIPFIQQYHTTRRQTGEVVDLPNRHADLFARLCLISDDAVEFLDIAHNIIGDNCLLFSGNKIGFSAPRVRRQIGCALELIIPANHQTGNVYSITIWRQRSSTQECRYRYCRGGRQYHRRNWSLHPTNRDLGITTRPVLRRRGSKVKLHCPHVCRQDTTNRGRNRHLSG
jgi:hypothetical protein